MSGASEGGARRGEVRRVDAAGVRLCVETRGPAAGAGGGEGAGDGGSGGEGAKDRLPVIVLHGFTGDASSMDPAAAPLESERAVHRIELVGHGRSDAPHDVAAYAMPRCVEQVAAAMDALGIGTAHVYGYSMGGRVALSLAAARPERVGSLVLVGATAGLETAEARAERVAADEALAARIERDGLEAFVDAWMALPLFASQKRLGEEALARARAQRLAGTATGYAQSLRGMGTGAMPPLHEALGGIDVPVCLVVGEEDAKFRAIAAALAAALPDARVEEIGEAGHAAHLEQPEAVAAVVRRFLADVDARRARGRSERARGHSECARPHSERAS